MWVFLNDAFLSIVAHRTKPDTLLVRARLKGDIERTFGQAKVWTDAEADYLYRAEVDRNVVALRLSEAIKGIEYPNFKSSVKDTDRHDAYLDVWSAMYSEQVRANPQPRTVSPSAYRYQADLHR
jgi:hypothetical protein